jgi:hypothetical protein
MKMSLLTLLFSVVFIFISCDGYRAKTPITDPDPDPFASIDEDITDDEWLDADTDLDNDIEDDREVLPDDDIIDIDDDIIVPPDDDPIEPPDDTEDPDEEGDDILTDDEFEDDDEDPDFEEECFNECSLLDSIQCSGTNVEKCTLVDDCMIWVKVEDCNDTDRLCFEDNFIGSSSKSNVREKVYKGTFIEATADAVVYEYFMDFDNETGQPLTFAVYVSDTEDGKYELLTSNVIEDPGKGRKMYSSGLLKTGDDDGIEIEDGKFYIFGAAWEHNMRSYYHSPFVGETFSFGKTLGGLAPSDTFPIPESFDSPNIGVASFPTKFNTGITDPDMCVCDDKCSEDSSRCIDNWIEECKQDSFGCLNWHQEEDCDYLTCLIDEGDAKCINTCVDECDLGEKRCMGNVLEECKEHIDECAYWTVEENCSDNSAAPYCEILEISPADAQCSDAPQTVVDHIAQSANSPKTTDNGHAHGVYVRADLDAVITGFKFYLTNLSKTDVYFSIYEGTSKSGEYNRIFSDFITMDFDETNPYLPDYYGVEDISVDISKDNFYFFQLWNSTGLEYYSTCRNFWNPPLKQTVTFGEAVGHSDTQLSEEPTEIRDLDDASGNCLYRMWIESHIR